MIELYKFHTDPASLLGGKEWMSLNKWIDSLKATIAFIIEDMNSNGWEMEDEDEDEDFHWNEIEIAFAAGDNKIILIWISGQERTRQAYFTLVGTNIQCYNMQDKLIGTVSALGDDDDLTEELYDIVSNLDWGLD